MYVAKETVHETHAETLVNRLPMEAGKSDALYIYILYIYILLLHGLLINHFPTDRCSPVSLPGGGLCRRGAVRGEMDEL